MLIIIKLYIAFYLQNMNVIKIKEKFGKGVRDGQTCQLQFPTLQKLICQKLKFQKIEKIGLDTNVTRGRHCTDGSRMNIDVIEVFDPLLLLNQKFNF